MNVETLREELQNTAVLVTREFRAWGKTKRVAELSMVVTEKIDGTNAQIAIENMPDGTLEVRAGSRTRWISPERDNYGFAQWVKDNEEELKKLGRGRHYGEWWGLGIQRGYGLNEKRFSLFNTGRPPETLPACVSQVPILHAGPLDNDMLKYIEGKLRHEGSVAAPGFMRPEGYCVYIPATGSIFKNPFDK